MMVRGYVEVMDGWDGIHRFAVMDWSNSGDSGWLAGAFPSRRDAVMFALRYAKDNNRDIHSGQIIPFNREVIT